MAHCMCSTIQRSFICEPNQAALNCLRLAAKHLKTTKPSVMDKSLIPRLLRGMAGLFSFVSNREKVGSYKIQDAGYWIPLEGSRIEEAGYPLHEIDTHQPTHNPQPETNGKLQAADVNRESSIVNCQTSNIKHQTSNPQPETNGNRQAADVNRELLIVNRQTSNFKHQTSNLKLVNLELRKDLTLPQPFFKAQ